MFSTLISLVLLFCFIESEFDNVYFYRIFYIENIFYESMFTGIKYQVFFQSKLLKKIVVK